MGLRKDNYLGGFLRCKFQVERISEAISHFIISVSFASLILLRLKVNAPRSVPLLVVNVNIKLTVIIMVAECQGRSRVELQINIFTVYYFWTAIIRERSLFTGWKTLTCEDFQDLN